MQALEAGGVHAAIELDALEAQVRHLQDVTDGCLYVGGRDEGASLTPVRVKVSDRDVRTLTVKGQGVRGSRRGRSHRRHTLREVNEDTARE